MICNNLANVEVCTYLLVYLAPRKFNAQCLSVPVICQCLCGWFACLPFQRAPSPLHALTGIDSTRYQMQLTVSVCAWLLSELADPTFCLPDLSGYVLSGYLSLFISVGYRIIMLNGCYVLKCFRQQDYYRYLSIVNIGTSCIIYDHAWLHINNYDVKSECLDQ